ncbi:helix-turn-helix domain-containing protein [Levilactobacillus tujiorum]|uniref:Helix-turn-helix domain-containing protein n=1 Tax=Levilactobacillus tujiorum TaxID=2912243 RepID=A0ABX1L208_9LACO|nr:helix-turn-helix transcriptional regulator [Levilactobacillus tujiorum]MCH5464167.1 helix-turn-helix domain-containing protein [Levilactobacillus tujiorum]NLR11647.1 helix-turn-helix domain-containing protein [Lactobacillus sp. HBUAS51387]NLR29071.1 helix-turn-helix domain-containing protein [Levilactobacillus tujiorum]
MATTITSFATAITVIGQYLQHRRQALGFSQEMVAAGICLPATIAQIEQGQHVPDTILLGRLCERLRLPLEQGLGGDFPIRRLPSFSRKVHRLARQQRYAELVTYMENPGRLQVLQTDEDLKSYYYYDGWAYYRATQDGPAALQRIRTGLSMIMPQHPLRYRTVEVLLMAMENYIQVASTQQFDCAGFERTLQIIRENRLIDRNASVGVIFQQYAQLCLQLGHPQQALAILLEGVDWATTHQAEGLLAADYYILAQVYLALQPAIVGATTNWLSGGTEQ